MDLLNLYVRVGARDEASPAIDDISNNIIGKLGSAAKTAAKALAGAFAVHKVYEFGKAAFDAYAQFEQLQGGAKLAFGEAYDFIEQRSQEAFKNVQMSQNDYLQQVNGLAVGLREAMGGNSQAAAELADKVVTAQADVVAAMGISQEAAQNAFNGIMRGNFTMLDNLQIGLPQTKEGFQEVIDKVNEWRVTQGKSGDLVIDSVADCQQAIVDYVEMVGYAGYASKEGMGTIEGSISATKAAWQNLVAEFGKPDADIAARIGDMFIALFGEGGKGGLVSNVTKRVKTIATNMVNAVSNAVGDAVEWLASNGAKMFQNALSNSTKAVKKWASDLAKNPIDVMGSLFKDDGSESNIFSRLADMGTDIYETIREWMPDIQQSVSLIAETIWTTISNNAPAILEAVGSAFNGVVQWLIENGPEIVGWLAETVMSIREWIFEHAPEILDAIGNTIDGIINWLIENGPAILEAIGQTFSNIVNTIIEHGPVILGYIAEMVGMVVGYLIEHAIDFFNAAIQWMQGLLDGSTEQGQAVRDWFANLPQMLLDALGNLGDLLKNAGMQIIEGFWNGLKAKWSEVTDWVSGIGSWIAEHKGPKAYDLGLLVPNGQWIMQGLGEGLQKGLPSVQGILSDVTDSIQTGINTNVSIADAKPSGNNAILAALGEIRDNMNMSVMLDSGALVGGIAPQMNTALGGLY